MEDLIIKYLNKELNHEEELRLKSWLHEGKNNRQVFEQIIADLQFEEQELKASEKKILQKIVNTSINKDTYMTRKYSIWQNWLKIAVIVTVAVSVGLLFFNQQNNTQSKIKVITKVEKQALPGQKLSIKLSDGSMVKLNSGSRLVVPEKFSSEIRHVFLEGEAFFEVVEDASCPFVVTTDDFIVKVLGTSFNIRSYQQELESSIAVVTGKVMVSNPDDSLNEINEMLIPDQMLVFSEDKSSWQRLNGINIDLILGWKDQKLVFRDEKIHVILETLSRWYGVEFQCKTVLDKEREYTAKFNNPTLKEVMESLSYNFQFNYIINEEKIIIQ